MSNATDLAALAPSIATVTLNGLPHTVHPFASTLCPYVLRGPRGGLVSTVRNVHSKRLHLMSGNKTHASYAVDTDGTFVIVAR